MSPRLEDAPQAPPAPSTSIALVPRAVAKVESAIRRLSSKVAAKRGSTTDRVDVSFVRDGEGLDYYSGVVVGPQSIGDRALAPATRDSVLEIFELLESDDYLRYTREFIRAGRRIAGEGWRYADIVTVLAAAADLVHPTSYLEIGVRRARSMAMVASRAPGCSIIGVDMWQADYADMDNPGPEFVRAQLASIGFDGPLELLSGDSHKLLPRLFETRPDLSFDLITVDGDHSRYGARQDLREVLPRLRIGGVVVFDDIRHPAHPYLHDVWNKAVTSDRRYATWEFDEIGFGVALAVRRW